ncbi:MAG: patatin-like phospholipase family protein [Tenericutes bacterium]|nr:patatin-like phospholipase family protein [Mycoplasmatota bacterium]
MYGLVLAGGGAKGAYQIGVWKALKELNIEISLAVGTSIGALNGALVAQNDYDLAEELWLNMSIHSVFSADQEILDGLSNALNKHIFKNDISFYRKLYSYISENKGLDISPLRTNIQSRLDEDKLMKSNIDFGFVTYSINERKPLKLFKNDIKKGEMKYYLLGSALVPGFSQDKNFPVKFIDGGIHDRFPIQMAIDKGCKDIIAVETGFKKLKKYTGANITYIIPSEDTGNFLFFDRDRSRRNLSLGYLDAMKTFEKLYGINYFFESDISDNQILRSLMKISSCKLQDLSTKSMDTEIVTIKQLLEVELPYLSKKLGIKNASSYKETIVTMLEYMLKLNEVERLKVYTYNEAIQLIDKVYNQNCIEKTVLKLLKQIFR